jgi:chemotaxis protein methyltransferase CheR
MIDNTTAADKPADILSKVPAEVLSSPALLFLYYRIERTLGIKAGSESLVKLNEHIEKDCGASFVENPAAFERFLSSRERIYDISKFLTVNETYFFRESVHFEILTELLPELAKLNRPLRICSAAVSIGCEAYSIAMLLDYNIKKGLDIDFTLDAFDINASAIEAAKSARYTENAFRLDGSSWKYILDSYLIPDNGEYVVSHNIRAKVNFFTHNIMRGLDRQYDIIFFRNSLIYFSSKHRLSALNNIAEALFNNGFLFLGISETSSVNHPLISNRFSRDAFYFQKTSSLNIHEQLQMKQKKETQNISHNPRREKNINPPPVKREEIPVSCVEIAEIIKTDEGKTNAQNVIDSLSGGTSDSLSGSCLAACALYYLNAQDFDLAQKAISFLEEYNGSEFTRFLKGELLFMQGFYEEAEKYYQEAAVKNRFFWPAFYRIAILAAEGNRTRYEYKIKKAIESIELSQNQGQDMEHNYECFIGGFSSDYFIRILEKKIDMERGVTWI